MGDFVAFGCFAQEEAVVAHVEVEALLAVVTKPHDGTDLADSALDTVVLGRLGRGQPMKYGQPDQALRLLLQPPHEICAVNLKAAVGLGAFSAARVVGAEAAPNRRLHIGALKGKKLLISLLDSQLPHRTIFFPTWLNYASV